MKIPAVYDLSDIITANFIFLRNTPIAFYRDKISRIQVEIYNTQPPGLVNGSFVHTRRNYKLSHKKQRRRHFATIARHRLGTLHYNDVIISTMASQITSLAIVYSTVYSGADQRKHQSSASLAFVRGIHRGPVNSPYKGPVTRKCFHLMTSSCFTLVVCMLQCRMAVHHDGWFAIDQSQPKRLLDLAWRPMSSLRVAYINNDSCLDKSLQKNASHFFKWTRYTYCNIFYRMCHTYSKLNNTHTHTYIYIYWYL